MSIAIVHPASSEPSDGTTTTVANGVRGRTWRQLEWRTLIRPAVAGLIVVAAYRISLLTLLESMRLDTPLAHLALVPFIAAGLAYATRNSDAGPAIHDRQLDWIVGLLLTVAALSANAILPARLSTEYWEWRVDLLTLPLFVGGVISLLFGVRTLWKFRYAVGFLLLAWPYPYTLVLDRWLGQFTQGTISALDTVLQHIRIATKVAGSDSTFAVVHQGKNITMSVASACSGANGMVGFTLVASAFLLVLNGSKKRKFAWLALGATLVWVLNIVRIMVIFWAAKRWGQTVAIDGFHPYVGLVVFNVAILVMVLLLKPFGLRVRQYKSRGVPGAVVDPHAPRPYRPQLGIAMCCVAAMSLGVGIFNGQLRDYDRIADSLGSPRLADFASSQETPIGWSLSKVAEYPEFQRFFGDDSQWVRYAYQSAGLTDAAFQSNVPIIVDVVDTPDRAALSAYGIEQCYTFHGYAISGRESIDLGDGLVGGMLTWTNPDTDNTYTQVYWHWPIKTADGGTRYERFTLVMNDQPTNTFTSPPLDSDGARELQLNVNDAIQGGGSDVDQARLVETRTFLVGFARELVRLRAPAAD